MSAAVLELSVGSCYLLCNDGLDICYSYCLHHAKKYPKLRPDSVLEKASHKVFLSLAQCPCYGMVNQEAMEKPP